MLRCCRSRRRTGLKLWLSDNPMAGPSSLTTGFSSPRGWSAEEDSDEDSGPPTVALEGRAEEGGASLPPKSWAALADVGEGTDSGAGPTRRTPQRRMGSAKHSSSLLERLASPNSVNLTRQQRPRRAKSAGATRTKPVFLRGAALTDADAPRAPTPELIAEGTSTTGDRTPRDDQYPWLQLHKDHTTASPVVVKVADSEMVSYLNETVTFWHGPGQETKWMLMRLGTDPSCATKPMGWVLASELVLRNQDHDTGSLSAFLSRCQLEDHAHGLRGLGVTDVESLALQGDQTFAEAGLPAPARRILRRALVTRSRELEAVKSARQRDKTITSERTRPLTGAADFRNLGHHDTMRTTPRFISGGAQIHLATHSAASLGIGEEWLKGQRRSSRATRMQRQCHDGYASPTRPSTAPSRSSETVDGSTHENSLNQHRQGMVGSGSTNASIAAHVVADRISAAGLWPQDTRRRYSGGGFALSSRSSSGNQAPAEIVPNINHSHQQPSGQALVSLSQVVLSSASSIVASADDSSGKESRVWLDNVATANSLRRSNKARSANKTQSSFGRVGIRPEGPQDETPLQPDAIVYAARDPSLLRPQPLPRARPGYIWCARPGGGYSQMTVAQRQSWLDQRLRCGEPVPPQVDPQGQTLPSTVRGEAARDTSAGEHDRGGSSSLVVSTWQLLSEPHVTKQPVSRSLIGGHRKQRTVLLHSRKPSLVQVHTIEATRRKDELRRRGQAAARWAEPGQANVGRDNGHKARSTAMHRNNKRGGVSFPVQTVPAHDLVWNGQAVYA